MFGSHALCIRLCIEKCIGKNLWSCILNGGERAKYLGVNAIVFIFQEGKKMVNGCICSMQHIPNGLGIMQGKIDSIKVKKATSFRFSLRFRLLKCAMMIFISLRLWTSFTSLFFVNILTHEHIKYDKIFTLLHWMNCIPCNCHTHTPIYSQYTIHNILPHFIDSIKFEMEQCKERRPHTIEIAHKFYESPFKGRH